MKLGVFLMPQQPRTGDPVRRFRECLGQTRLARDAGFDAVAAGHHYVSPPYQAVRTGLRSEQADRGQIGVLRHAGG